MKLSKPVFFFLCLCYTLPGFTQQTFFEFGVSKNFNQLIEGKNKATPLRWVDVNTSDTTWFTKGSILVGKGLPIGVVRSEKMYQNFIMHVEWRHMEKGGNSGIFVWCDAKPEEDSRLPSGVEVQMLELDWVNQHKQNGETPPIAYVHGELFGAGQTRTIPDNPRGERSKSIENRCLGAGEWNVYTIVCVDGTIKLSVNGKFVNGIRQSSQRKGYLCLEAEGARIEFRNLQIIELEEGFILPEHVVEGL
ncbi:MAG: DUF1080 domain-containing protein [Chitinophagaceae bacterium]|nr:DUF1080 domain-containing protein [Chitinophagaceae bacterium]